MEKRRNVYLDMKTLDEARRAMFAAFPGFGVLPPETVPAVEAVGRALAEPVFARFSSPNFHAAAMDGVAIRAALTFGAREGAPRELVLGRDAFWINTGHPLPEGTDAVVMAEHVQILDEGRVSVEAPAAPWQYVRKVGEDIVATQLLFARNHEITPACLGALLSGGAFEVAVRRRPRVVILPTGNELVDWRRVITGKLERGEVIESNGHVLAGLVAAAGGEPVRREIIPDRFPEILDALRAAASAADLVLAVGGSSAGSEDYTREAVAELGEVLIHGVTIMPGKPLIVGRVRDTPVMGMPGYPVSMIVAFEQFARPLIRHMLGLPDPERTVVDVYPTRDLTSKAGLEEFLRVKLGRVGDRIMATPLPRGAGSITTFTEADGIIRIPRHVEGISEDRAVPAELLRPLRQIEDTLVVVGSHDNALDILADQLRVGGGPVRLSSSHVGSMGGLMAVKRGRCHLAGTHLLDPLDGSYNVSYVRRFLKDVPVKMVHLVNRDQGLMVLPGNPKGIRTIADLARPDLRFVNRQSGSGTRILLDWKLRELGVNPGDIAGYDTDEYTHMAVAVAVLSGRADAGLGIYAAARALGLDFISVVTEQYDLVMPEAVFATDRMAHLLEVIRSAEFRNRVEGLGGYDTRRTGEILLQGNPGASGMG